MAMRDEITIGLLAAFALSGATLAGAWGFEHLAGLAPCKMCIWQRFPYAIVILLTGLGAMLVLSRRPGLATLTLGAVGLTAAVGAGLGVYHVGVEQRWWLGPQSCSGTPQPTSIEALREALYATPVVRCDEVPWDLMGVSLAGFNDLISLAIVVIAASALWLAREGIGRAELSMEGR